jgi:hypothetical protein
VDEKRLVNLDGTPVEDEAPPSDDAFRPPVQKTPELEVVPTVHAERPVERVGEALVGRRAAPPEERTSLGQAGGEVAAFLLALPVSLLPARWRRGALANLPLTAATTVSGVLETITALLAGGWLFERYRHAIADQAMAAMGRRMGEGIAQPDKLYMTLETMGATLLISFLLSPAGLACFYFFAEGLVRLAAGLASEALGTAPLALAAAGVHLVRKRTQPTSEFEAYDAHHRFEEDVQLTQMRERVRRWRRGVEPPPPPDEMRKNDVTGEVRIYTARELGWQRRTSVEIDGEIYEVIDSGPAPAPHRLEYALRPVPASTAVRNIVVYR